MSKCPNCNSSNTKTLNMVWSSGTRNGKSGFGGLGISTSGRVTLGGGRGRSSSQSNLAATCAPPQKSSMPKIIVGLLGIMFVPPLFSGVLSIFTEPKLLHGILNFVVCAPLLGLLVWGLMKLYRKLDGNNKQAQANYARTWICLKCNTRFIPYSPSSEETKLMADKMTKDLEEVFDKYKRSK